MNTVQRGIMSEARFLHIFAPSFLHTHEKEKGLQEPDAGAFFVLGLKGRREVEETAVRSRRKAC